MFEIRDPSGEPDVAGAAWARIPRAASACEASTAKLPWGSGRHTCATANGGCKAAAESSSRAHAGNRVNTAYLVLERTPIPPFTAAFRYTNISGAESAAPLNLRADRRPLNPQHPQRIADVRVPVR